MMELLLNILNIVKKIAMKQSYQKNLMRVQEEMDRIVNQIGRKGKKRIYSSKYAVSSILYCSNCGDVYRRIMRNNRGKKYASLEMFYKDNPWTRSI